MFADTALHVRRAMSTLADLKVHLQMMSRQRAKMYSKMTTAAMYGSQEKRLE